MIPKNRIPAHPGEILEREYLEPLGLSVDGLARHLAIAAAGLREIVHGSAPMTPELAWKLAQAFDSTPEFWLQLQAHHDLAVHRPDHAVPKLLPVS